MIGTTGAVRLVMKLGIDATLGIGCAVMTLGGLGMVASVTLGLTSAASIVVPMAVYLGGMGMVLPQAFAGAMTPFPERAGAASALLGFIQQGASAICGAIVGVLLGSTAWPLVGAVAFMACASLVLWVATRGIRAHAVHASAAE